MVLIYSAPNAQPMSMAPPHPNMPPPPQNSQAAAYQQPMPPPVSGKFYHKINANNCTKLF